MSVTTLPVSIGATPSWPANAASVAALLPFAPTVEALPSLEAPAPVAELTVLASLDAPALLALLKAASPLPLASTAGGWSTSSTTPGVSGGASGVGGGTGSGGSGAGSGGGTEGSPVGRSGADGSTTGAGTGGGVGGATNPSSDGALKVSNQLLVAFVTTPDATVDDSEFTWNGTPTAETESLLCTGGAEPGITRWPSGSSRNHSTALGILWVRKMEGTKPRARTGEARICAHHGASPTPGPSMPPQYRTSPAWSLNDPIWSLG